MIEKIIFSIISFLLFTYVFIFKLIKKNDTMYLTIILMQAIGILLNFLQILFGILTATIFRFICYVLCIIIPLLVLIIEKKGFNFDELLYIAISKVYIIFNRKKQAKDILIKLVSKYDKSYVGHKMLAEIYEYEGGMRKAIDEYVKVLDIRGNDYKSYFKISKLLKDLDKKEESIEMLSILVNKKPELYEPAQMLSELLIEKGKYKETINICTKAVKHNPEKADLYYNLGIAYARINDFSVSKHCFQKAAELDNNLYNAYYRLGQISLLYRDIDTAEQYFLQAIYGEVEAKAYYQLSKIYIMRNNKSKASVYINKAIEVDANYYNTIKSEPIFLPIRNQIQKPSMENKQEGITESQKEKDISEYLDDTYSLTKALNKTETKKNSRKF